MRFGARKIASSAFWRTVEVGGNEAISFLFFVAMTRLLAPEQFGIVALAGSLLQLGNAMLTQGVPDALIQRDQIDERHVRSALWTQFWFALALVAVLCAIAWPMALILRRPDFPPILLAMAPILLLQALSTPMHAMLRRRLALRAIAIRTLTGTAVGGILAILLARHGGGAWALVAQQWSVALVGLTVLTVMSPVKPWPLTRDRPAQAELVSIARPIIIGQFISNAVRRLDILALGLFLGNFEVGIYFLISRIVLSVQMVTQNSIGEISLVVLSRLQRDPARHRAALRQTLQVTAFACLGSFGLIGILADHLVPAVFGPVWAAAQFPLQLTCLFASAGALIAVSGQILVSGSAARLAATATVGTALVQLAMILGAARFGLQSMVIAIGVGQLLAAPVILYFTARKFDLRLSRLVFDLAPLLAGFAVARGAAALFPFSPQWGPVLLASLLFSALMTLTAAWVFRAQLRRAARVLGIRNDD